MSETFDVSNRVRIKDTGSEGYVFWLKPDGLIQLSMIDGSGYEVCAPEDLERAPDPTPEDRHATHELVCPYCGYETGDSWELRSDHGKASCGRCEKEFHYARYTVCTYNTSVDEDRV